MKAKFSILTVLIIVLISQKSPQTRRVITGDDFNFEFFTSNVKLKKFDFDKKYFWFKNGNIHVSKGSASGEVLNGLFTKTYISENLAEKGNYSNGLKTGNWITWYENGNQQTVNYWTRGVKNGGFKRFSESGKIVLSGKYRNGKKTGKWIDYVKNDTIIFKRDNLFEKDLKESDSEKDTINFFKKMNIFFKKIVKKDSLKVKENQQKVKRKQSKSNRKVSEKKPRKK